VREAKAKLNLHTTIVILLFIQLEKRSVSTSWWSLDLNYTIAIEHLECNDFYFIISSKVR
jgi:hypothetical protein